MIFVVVLLLLVVVAQLWGLNSAVSNLTQELRNAGRAIPTRA